MYLSRCVFLCKIHLQVPVDELTLAQTNHLHTEHTADRHERIFNKIHFLKPKLWPHKAVLFWKILKHVFQTARTKHHCILKAIKHDTSRHSHRWLGGTIKTRWAGTERLNVWVWFYWPDIEWNGHHCVEDDDVSPEAEEASVGGALVFAVVQIPGVGADLFVPEGVTDGQTCRHQDQQCKDLRGGRTEKTDIQYNRAMSWMANNSVMKCSWAHVELSFQWCPFHTKSSHHHLLQMNPSTCGMFRSFWAFNKSFIATVPTC